MFAGDFLLDFAGGPQSSVRAICSRYPSPSEIYVEPNELFLSDGAERLHVPSPASTGHGSSSFPHKR